MKQLIALVLALGSPCLSSADPVTDWNVTATTASFAAGLDNEFGCVDPLHQSRMLAMMHVAIHDALNAIDRRYQPYAYDGAGAPGASPEAAVAAAARDVLVALFPQLPPDIGPTPGPAVALVETAYANALASIPNSPAKTQGISSVRPQPQPFSHCDMATGPTRRSSISITCAGPIPETSSSFPASRSRRRPCGER